MIVEVYNFMINIEILLIDIYIFSSRYLITYLRNKTNN